MSSQSLSAPDFTDRLRVQEAATIARVAAGVIYLSIYRNHFYSSIVTARLGEILPRPSRIPLDSKTRFLSPTQSAASEAYFAFSQTNNFAKFYPHGETR
jgi:hypothetical protein